MYAVFFSSFIPTEARPKAEQSLGNWVGKENKLMNKKKVRRHDDGTTIFAAIRRVIGIYHSAIILFLFQTEKVKSQCSKSDESQMEGKLIRRLKVFQQSLVT